MSYNPRWHRDLRQAHRVGAVFGYSPDLVDWLEPLLEHLDEVIVLHQNPLSQKQLNRFNDMGVDCIRKRFDEDEDGLEYLNCGLGIMSSRWTLYLNPHERIEGLEELPKIIKCMNDAEQSAGLIQTQYLGFTRPEIRLFRRTFYRFSKNGVGQAFKATTPPLCEIDTIQIYTDKALCGTLPLAHIARAVLAPTEQAYIELVKAGSQLVFSNDKSEVHTAIYILKEAVKLNSVRPEAYTFLKEAFQRMGMKREAKEASAKIYPLFAKNWSSEWMHEMS